jgi:Domain of unknown function (DUF2019)
MTKVNLKSMSVDELAHRFVEIAIAQDWALFEDAIAKYKRLYREMDEIRSELKSRPGDQRRVLIQLYDHPNIQVRLKAALSTLALAPDAVRPVLERIAKSGAYPQAADAGFALDRLDGHPIVPGIPLD